MPRNKTIFIKLKHARQFAVIKSDMELHLKPTNSLVKHRQTERQTDIRKDMVSA
jgi:hypothetical protein